MGSRCSFCGTTGGPFLQVQGSGRVQIAETGETVRVSYADGAGPADANETAADPSRGCK